MTVSRFMTTEVISIHCDNHLFAAQRLMDWEGVRDLPVVDDDGALVGLLSEQTLLEHWSGSECVSASGEQVEQRLWKRPVKEVMQRAVRVVQPDTPVDEAAQILRDAGIDCLPVVSGRNLAGIVTDHDLQKAVQDDSDADDLDLCFEKFPTPSFSH